MNAMNVAGQGQATPNALAGSPRFLAGFIRQFGRPSGPLGHLAGLLMARRNDEANRWVVDLLDVQPSDRVLEVGFGPGLAIQMLAARAWSGLVAGVDHSDVMLKHTSRRNRAAIRAGRVELRRGSVAELPYPDAHFTKALTLNSLQFWPSAEAGLRELHRVLSPGGRLVVGIRLRRETAGRMDPSRYGLPPARLVELEALLRLVEFEQVETRVRDFGRQTIAALIALR